MKLYAGIDLHSNNSMVAIIDEQDRVIAQAVNTKKVSGTFLVLITEGSRAMRPLLRAEVEQPYKGS